MRRLRVSSAIICTLAIASLSLGTLVQAGVPAGSDPTGRSDSHAKDQEEIPGFDLKNLDPSCKPCQDFYKYADGGWMASNPIPPAYPSWGSFNGLAEKNNEKLRAILESAESAKAAQGSNLQEIGDFYYSGMDEESVESQGVKPLASEFARIDKIESLADLQSAIAHLHVEGVPVVFRFGGTPDFKNSSMEIAAAFQGGLGLPDRDYYLKTDEHSKQIQAEYLRHVANMFALLGEDAQKSDDDAKTVMDIETKLATSSMSRTETRNPDNIYHKMAPEQFQEQTPNFSWSRYFSEIGHPAIKEINVAQPEFFKALNSLLTSTDLAAWRTYLRWHLIHAAAPYLSSKFVDEEFNFSGKTLTGAKENQPRWRRVVAATDRNLGEALGQEYVKRYFPPEAKAAAIRMVNNLFDALRQDINTLPWMGDETKHNALEKLNAIIKKIGYPDKWIDYSALKIDRGPYVLNVMRAHEFEIKRDIAKIGKPVDRSEWGMTPPTVNAYYNPTVNEIVFPAGILQPPFYDPKADDAINYGGIGAVIGHEMTHGFDDQGSKFDAKGNLSNWWSPEDLKNFKERAECVVNQFNGYVVMDDVHENGKLVAGESIADLGGLTLAYKAFEKSLEGKPRPKDIDGFSPEQRFFLGWAQVWATNSRPEFERLMANTNPHPLARFRGNGPLRNMPAFANAFHCTAPDPMVRPDKERCQIW